MMKKYDQKYLLSVIPFNLILSSTKKEDQETKILFFSLIVCSFDIRIFSLASALTLYLFIFRIK